MLPSRNDGSSTMDQNDQNDHIDPALLENYEEVTLPYLD